ncbi:uncharacterized protein MONBRDRAFT_16818 [Monosiga brevicollis MX1]|uniref:CHCH domain-containing protein n=1 Tax=Monosiga brevicollis TaxID=81824 RepID=A9UXM8_MONBE|nr:uncharacterized protein MONBRDRAFT_16818 [Monosiga brevicollis MX1]EDQ90037.1 predicted protein [Monosiga brevicollis MX1]|eukprot:XP_001745459.1 hypothetical protein [Monosiga brevicollis MX1]
MCAQEKAASYACLDRNAYDRTKCTAFFDAYNECRKRWQKARSKLRQKENDKIGLFGIRTDDEDSATAPAKDAGQR